MLQNIELAKKRVKIRVAEGGHNIEPEVIERRYIKGIKKLEILTDKFEPHKMTLQEYFERYH